MKFIEDINGIKKNDLDSFIISVLKDIIPGKKVLVIIPDYTRVDFTGKIAPVLIDVLKKNGTEKIDFLNAGGTHREMTDFEFKKKLGLVNKSNYVSFLNHNYSSKKNLINIGNIPAGLVREKTNGQLFMPIPVTVNKLIFSGYNTIIAISGTVPHEASGYSGGLKIFFPGISGPEVIDLFHWSAVLVGITDIIGTIENNARDIINEGSRLIFSNIKCNAFTMNMVSSEPSGFVAANGLYFDEGYDGFIRAYKSAAIMSSKVHIKYIKSPILRAVQVIPDCYDEIWTAAKGSYKLQKPGVMAENGEVILYGPHIKCFHSDKKIEREILETGYHCRGRICSILDSGKKISRNSASHLINAAGPGIYDKKTGKEKQNFRLTLATAIPEVVCTMVGLKYCDPNTIKKTDFLNEDSLWIEEGGKYLYMLNKEREH